MCSCLYIQTLFWDLGSVRRNWLVNSFEALTVRKARRASELKKLPKNIVVLRNFIHALS
jgi:hypothetical protein